MPRKRPHRVRALHDRQPPTAIPGVPLSTSRALDRLDRRAVSSNRIRLALTGWRRVAHKPRSALQKDNNDWVQFGGPLDRNTLEEAMRALNRRQRAPLHREIARLDALFEQKTLNDPLANPSLLWWSRRC